MSIYENLELLPEDIQGWNGNSPFFFNIIKGLQPKTIIEVGTWKGQSAINMGNICRTLGLQTTIYCVDTWLGSLEFIGETSPERNLMLKNGYPQVYYQFISNVVHRGLQDYIKPFTTTSSIGAKWFKKAGIEAQMVYIDASHEPDEVLRDLTDYYDLVPKGVIFGDDWTWEGMQETVTKFCNERGCKLEVFENNFWVITK